MNETTICNIKAGAVCNECLERIDVAIILAEAIHKIQCQECDGTDVESRRLRLDIIMQIVLLQTEGEECKKQIRLLNFLLWKAIGCNR